MQSPLSHVAEKIAKSRYYLKDKDGNVIENWEQLSWRVTNYVCRDESEAFKKDVFDVIYNTKFLPNTPCLVNAGKSHKSAGLSACFVTKDPEDSWVEIMDNVKRFGDVARVGGGCGVSFSKIRPEGAPVFGSSHAKACGPIEAMRMVSEAMSSITQSGIRGMANMAVLHCWHPDVFNFVKCKQRTRALKTMLKEDIFGHFDQLQDNSHDHLNIVLDKFISNFNISVMATDDFMKAVKNDSDWNLEFEGNVHKTIKARELFDLIAENAWKNGDPGLLFGDTINNGPYKYSGQTITATNPCFHPDTLVAVADGRNFIPIKQLADEGKDVPVYCCDPATGNIHIRMGRNPRKTREKSELFKVTFDDGGSIITTPDHKILLRNGQYVPVNELTIGSSIMSMCKFEYVSHQQKYLGITRGDGQSTKPEHRMVFEFYNGRSLSDEELVHHKDFSGLNNVHTNLEAMTYNEHSAYHRQFSNPMIDWWKTLPEEEKQRYRDTMSTSTSGKKNGMYGKTHSGETKQKIGNKTLERTASYDYCKNLSRAIADGWNDDAKQQAQSKRKKQDWQNGLYDNLRQVHMKLCDFCGSLFEGKPSIVDKQSYCSNKCVGLSSKISATDVINMAGEFVSAANLYPNVVSWEKLENKPFSREVVRKEFGNFCHLSDLLVDKGHFARVMKNTKMSKKMVAGAIVEWTTRNGKEPTISDIKKDICSQQTLNRLGGYTSLLSMARKLCSQHMVNHKVVSVEQLSDVSDVYNITIDEFHNLCVLSSTNVKTVINGAKSNIDVSRYSTVVYKNCGEQCLPEYGVCNLGSIDVSKLYDQETKDLNWKEFKHIIRTAIQFLDDVVSNNKFPSKEFEVWGLNNRPVGLGIMGLADLFLKMKITYGSKQSLELAEKIAEFLEKHAHAKSVELGKERGTPICCNHKELDYRRNVTVTSIAPTGSISLLAGCSSSIEPVFAPTIYRYDNTGSHVLAHPDAKKSYFRCALDKEENGEREVQWKEHIAMQAAFQKFGSSAISKTINMPNSATIDDVKSAYMAAWEQGCKGITVYRDGCKTTQVLNTSQKPEIGFNKVEERPEELSCDIFATTAEGFNWHLIIGKHADRPYEIFAVNGRVELPNSGKIIKVKRRHYLLQDDSGNVLIENLAEEEASIHPKISLETRRFSLELRSGIHPKHIVEQIDKSNDVINSFSKAAGRVLKKNYLSDEDCKSIAVDVACPECAKNGTETEVISESGCWKCPSCHWSKCG